jgi:hypothetical protein
VIKSEEQATRVNKTLTLIFSIKLHVLFKDWQAFDCGGSPRVAEEVLIYTRLLRGLATVSWYLTKMSSTAKDSLSPFLRSINLPGHVLRSFWMAAILDAWCPLHPNTQDFLQAGRGLASADISHQNCSSWNEKPIYTKHRLHYDSCEADQNGEATHRLAVLGRVRFSVEQNIVCPEDE